ncbi:hypothetical protein QTG56_25315 (plasmid) [Rossellomorea sp. AcN35-11]|nr:hypothetical protein QTG56_25315 [Rossellomorea sp. AcN35-11]
MSDNQLFLSTSDAAKKWGISSDVIRKAINKGDFDNQLEKNLVIKKQTGTTFRWLIHPKAMVEVFNTNKTVTVQKKTKNSM